jgi:molybdopterin-synthase adenylyltransferase
MDEESKRVLLGRIFSEKGINNELTLRQAEELSTETGISLRLVESFALEKNIIPCRYHRNIGSIGIAGQRSLLESTTLVVGLGGLGGYVVEELSRSGVGRIVGVDPDIFDETNLNRQLVATAENLGQKKTEETSRRVTWINPATEFVGIATPFEDLPDELFAGVDLVFDCLDGIEKKLRLSERASRAKVPLVHGAIAGFYGQVCVVWPGTGLLEKVCARQKQGIEKELGNLSFTPALAGSLMVAEGVKVLTGRSQKQIQKLMFFDLLEDEWQTIFP